MEILSDTYIAARRKRTAAEHAALEEAATQLARCAGCERRVGLPGAEATDRGYSGVRLLPVDGHLDLAMLPDLAVSVQVFGEFGPTIHKFRTATVRERFYNQNKSLAIR